MAKLLDPEALAAIARDDAEASVRDAALTMLRDIALDAFEGVDESGSLSAVEALTDERALVQIAKTSLRESVASRALVGGLPEREAKESLRNLKALVEHA